ncbi:hypothetical protein KGM_206953 [Danaus plexippus plexippus]|uniref:Phosphatidylinositol transfer protein N-terminal domain-containing protein n=1 Tax=Danaus plexippus plexippus TaxID=278856 RepID=A0A212FBR1_DANPL|nr:hypothetical protein KGM_206953 [Danaus plexippus plexippus]
MLIKEYRVTLPLTVEEYQVAQLFCVAEVSKNETGGGEGIEVIKNEPFKDYPLLVKNDPKTASSSKRGGVKAVGLDSCMTCGPCLEDGGKYSSGQYTYKIYHLASKVPAFIRLLAPKGSLEVHEEAWNAYPYCRTVLTNPGYMKENFVICIESLHLPDVGDQNNVHELTPEKLKNREVVHIDIANDPLSASDYKPETDPTKFKSSKTGRGPLVGPLWKNDVTPVMTCYKLVTAEFKWFGLQSKVENLIQKSERRLFTIFHRQVFCSMDDWYGMTMADIRAIEERTKEELEKLRREGEVRGMRAENE